MHISLYSKVLLGKGWFGIVSNCTNTTYLTSSTVNTGLVITQVITRPMFTILYNASPNLHWTHVINYIETWVTTRVLSVMFCWFSIIPFLRILWFHLGTPFYINTWELAFMFWNQLIDLKVSNYFIRSIEENGHELIM